MTAAGEADRTVDTTLQASRALLGVVARSLAPVQDRVSPAQFRVLVLLTGNGAMASGRLAEHLGVAPSTFSRMADRLVAGGWIERQEAESRREVRIVLTTAGAGLVDVVTRRRREALAEILDRLPPDGRAKVAEALELFAAAAGEPDADDLAGLGL